jgi:hypothetical protein
MVYDNQLEERERGWGLFRKKKLRKSGTIIDQNLSFPLIWYYGV